MASKFAFIVGATKGYIPELTALLNSLDYIGNEQDVHVLGIELDSSFTNQFSQLSYRVIFHEITEEEWQLGRGRSEIVCRKRYWYAAHIGLDYDAVCILDADLIFVRNPIQFFVMAEKTGYIYGPCKEQNKVYDDDHHLVFGRWKWKVPRGFYNDKDLCNCPVFIDAKKWNEALRISWYVFIHGDFKAPDMDAMNLAFLHYGGYDQTIKLPGLQWLGTNEQHLKPYIRVIENHGKLQTENGIELFSYHGQYYKEKWRNQQLINRHNCANGYLKATECCDDIAKGSMNTLYNYFLKILDWNIKIPHVEYTNT
jgi:hypothetical protein